MNSAAGIIQVLAAGKCLGCLISVVFIIDVYVGAAAILKKINLYRAVGFI
jgi:hypothetical protein